MKARFQIKIRVCFSPCLSDFMLSDGIKGHPSLTPHRDNLLPSNISQLSTAICLICIISKPWKYIKAKRAYYLLKKFSFQYFYSHQERLTYVFDLLHYMLANLSYKESHSILRFVGYMVCHSYSALLLWHDSSHRQYINKWAQLYSNKILLTKMGSIWPRDHNSQTSVLHHRYNFKMQLLRSYHIVDAQKLQDSCWHLLSASKMLKTHQHSGSWKMRHDFSRKSEYTEKYFFVPCL